MTSPVNLDSLFDNIDTLSEKLAESQKKAAGPKGKTGGGTPNYKNLDMVFIGVPVGSYELKVIADSEGKLVEEIMLHSVKIGASKVTVNCKGEGCEICQRVKKLSDMDNKAAWKFNPYKLTKLLIKIGDVNEGAKSLTPGKVYAAYADEKFLKPLLDSIRTNKKYFKDGLGKMLTASETSPGFLVTSSRAKKRSTYNFQFVDQISIPGIDVKETFGSENFKNSSFGFFRNNFINNKKVEEAVRLLDSLIVNTAKTGAKASDTPPAGGGASDQGKTETPEKSTPQETTTQSTPEVDQNDAATPPFQVDTPVNEVETQAKEAVAQADATTTVSDTVVGGVPVINCKDLGANNLPKCISYFDPNNEMCSSQCQHKRDCLMKAMEAGRI